jgi:hypothetical protein
MTNRQRAENREEPTALGSYMTAGGTATGLQLRCNEARVRELVPRLRDSE